MTGKIVLSIRNASKYYGAFRALTNISLDIYENEFFALLGPSGGGKSTLLRSFAGFEEIDKGSILLDGQDITKVKPNRRPINLMFQSYALFPHMTVAKNIAYGLEMDGLGKDEIRRRVDEIVRMTHLEAFRDRKPGQLSGGQRQRVALARALVKQPRVLLLDEPLGALDKNLREQMRLELKRIQHEFGITFIIVTHDQEEALVLADRIAILNQGEIVQVGTPKEVYERPRNLFAAEFIGNMNVLQGTLAKGSLVFGENRSLSCPDAQQLAEGTPACLAVRPERIVLTTDAPVQGQQHVKGRIKAITYHGLDENVHVELYDGNAIFVARVAASDEVLGLLNEGQDVWCNFPPKAAHLFAMP